MDEKVLFYNFWSVSNDNIYCIQLNSFVNIFGYNLEIYGV